MRIISKFHDYYDCGLAHGIDDQLMYIREKKEILHKRTNGNKFNGLKPAMFENEVFGLSPRFGVKTDRFLVGFCGKIYKGVRLQHDKYGNYGDACYAYTLEGVSSFYKEYCTKKQYEAFLGQRQRGNRFVPSLYRYDKHFKNQSDPEKYSEYFRDNHLPLFIVSDWNNYSQEIVVTHNGSLRDVEFFKVFDSYTAFQEISMYIGGVLGVGEPHMLDISDECMRDAKGFNDISFKTRPGTKKPRGQKRA